MDQQTQQFVNRHTVVLDLRLLRQAQGLSQVEVGRLAGLTQPAVARFEADRTVPSLDTVLKVAAGLGAVVEVRGAGEDAPL